MEILHHSPLLRSIPTRWRNSAFASDGHSNLGSRVGRATVHCNYSAKNEEIGSEKWLAKATPLEVLGLQDDCTEDDIKAAFRSKVKEFHPDVYKGPSNASTIVQRVIQAYELVQLIGAIFGAHICCISAKSWLSMKILMMYVSRGECIQRKSLDPFEEPECEALDIFVNELLCIGKGCLYSCVKRAPHAFAYDSDTGCAHAITQGQGEDYEVQLAVGQCPRNCIYYVTPAQRIILEELLKRTLEGAYYSNESSLLESLISRANFENNRYQGHSKKNAKHSTEWVDWF